MYTLLSLDSDATVLHYPSDFLGTFTDKEELLQAADHVYNQLINDMQNNGTDPVDIYKDIHAEPLLGFLAIKPNVIIDQDDLEQAIPIVVNRDFQAIVQK